MGLKAGLVFLGSGGVVRYAGFRPLLFFKVCLKCLVRFGPWYGFVIHYKVRLFALEAFLLSFHHIPYG